MKYKFLIIVINIIFLANIVNSAEYNLEIFFTNKSDSMKLSENLNYLHIQSTGVWKDSSGDYGNIVCYGRVLQDKKSGIFLDVYCEAVNQNQIKFWLRLLRDSSQRDAGIGSSEYINGEEKYTKFIGKKCIYASKVFGSNAIVNQKCKFN